MFNYGCARKKKNSVSVFFLLGAVIFSYNMSCLLQPIPDMSANTGREKEEKTGILLLLLLISPLFFFFLCLFFRPRFLMYQRRLLFP